MPAGLAPAELDWWLNVRKKRLQAIRDALPADPVSFRDQVRAILSDKRNKEVSDWCRIDEICLLLGYALVFASALLRILVP